MKQEIITKQVKGLLIKAITKKCKEKGTNKIDVFIKHSEIEPYVSAFYTNKQERIFDVLEFKELCNAAESMIYSSLGFNVGKDTPKWIHKFIVKSCSDYNIEPLDAKYLLVKSGGDIKAYMFHKDFQNGRKEISLDYIFETK